MGDWKVLNSFANALLSQQGMLQSNFNWLLTCWARLDTRLNSCHFCKNYITKMMWWQPYCARTPTTHQLTGLVENREMKPIGIYIWGWFGGHDGQRPLGKFGQDAGVLGDISFIYHALWSLKLCRPFTFIDSYILHTEWKVISNSLRR